MSMQDEDNDLKVQRVGRAAIGKLKTSIERLIATDPAKSKDTLVVRRTNEITQLLDIFQEDPQLLDPHLRVLLPPLLSSYSEVIQDGDFLAGIPAAHTYANAVARVLYAFCKVRGSKVISRFQNNEPKYLEPVAQALNAVIFINLSSEEDGKGLDADAVDSENISNAERPRCWEQEYVLLLWFSHLVLTPFDLSLVSPIHSSTTGPMGFQTSKSLPVVAYRALEFGLRALQSASLQRDAAALLLVRLALRPDMQNYGVLNSLISWCLCRLSEAEVDSKIHKLIGVLSALNGIVRLANLHDIANEAMAIFSAVTEIFYSNDTVNEVVRSSAVAKGLSIKIQRNLLGQVLQVTDNADRTCISLRQKMFEEMSALEDIIDYLLRSLAERDTQVRLISSKAISMLALKLDPELADEVLEAVLGSLNEDVLTKGSLRSLAAVNATRWHGLVITLSHMLFRRSPRPTRLPEILEALYLALNFEQRSSAGASVGGNIRDAANFGLWSLARRYSTAELEKCNMSPIQLHAAGNEMVSAMQMSANILVNAACLDSSGNVRRGSSAALQELIGRHPDTIHNGIALIQVVDYHAVGLRRRAIEDVSYDAAHLGNMYLDSLMEGLRGWKGMSASDRASREYAAHAMGRLATLQTHQLKTESVSKILSGLENTPRHEVEERHGLMLALTAICDETVRVRPADGGNRLVHEVVDFEQINSFWNLFDETLKITSKDMTASQRPELTASGIIGLTGALSLCSLSLKECLQKQSKPLDHILKPTETTMEMLTICLKGFKDQALAEIDVACASLGQFVGWDGCHHLALSWLKDLRKGFRVSRIPGIQVALGSLWTQLRLHEKSCPTASPKIRHEILDTLIHNSGLSLEIEARVVAIRSLKIVIHGLVRHKFSDDVFRSTISNILEGLLVSLNDYTITERGDVGSLVRIEALDALKALYDSKKPAKYDPELVQKCHSAVLRLALEKLDKVRLEAAKCLQAGGFWVSMDTELHNLTDVSTYTYFHTILTGLRQLSTSQTPQYNPSATASLLTGISSSAGAGSDQIMQISRSALSDILDALPTLPSSAPDRPKTSRTTALSDIAHTFLDVLAANISPTPNDRVLTPLLHTLAFLLDARILQRLAPCLSPGDGNGLGAPPPFKWRMLLSLVQKSHFRSGNLARVLAALEVYRGLAEIESVRPEVVAKVAGMMRGHPFVKVRKATAEVAWVVSGGWEGLRGFEGGEVGGEEGRIVEGFERAMVGR